MSKEKVEQVLASYRLKFLQLGIPKIEYPHRFIARENKNILAHCHGMLDEMEEFLRQNRMEKLYRWLGFVQGCLWSAGIYSIEEMKNHNRSE